MRVQAIAPASLYLFVKLAVNFYQAHDLNSQLFYQQVTQLVLTALPQFVVVMCALVKVLK
jgi:hypothetical protein